MTCHSDGWRVACTGRYVQFPGVFWAGVGEGSCVLGLHFGGFVASKSESVHAAHQRRDVSDTGQCRVRPQSDHSAGTVERQGALGRGAQAGMEEATIQSARTEVRTWVSLDSLARWLKAQGCGVAELRVV